MTALGILIGIGCFLFLIWEMHADADMQRIGERLRGWWLERQLTRQAITRLRRIRRGR